MSSIVTTATVSTVTAAITIEGLGQMMMLVSLVLLGLVLLAKEITAVSDSRSGRALARGLDIGVAPLLAVFLLILALNVVTYFTN